MIFWSWKRKINSCRMKNNEELITNKPLVINVLFLFSVKNFVGSVDLFLLPMTNKSQVTHLIYQNHGIVHTRCIITITTHMCYVPHVNFRFVSVRMHVKLILTYQEAGDFSYGRNMTWGQISTHARVCEFSSLREK